MMQAVTQNKKLKPNSPWRALELLLFDYSRLWVEARNCFLVEMSRDWKMQVNEMGAIMKCKQEVSQDKNVNQWKTKRKPIANTSNLFRGSSHCSTSPPPPPWRIFTKSAKRITRGLHKTGVPNSHQSNPLHKRDLNTKKVQVTRWSKRPQTSLLQLLIEWERFLAQEVKWENSVVMKWERVWKHWKTSIKMHF